MKILSPLFLLLTLLCLGLPLMAQDGGAPNTFAPTPVSIMDAKADLNPIPKNGVVPLKTIAGDFATNAVAASGKYLERRITVSGRIASLRKGHGENFVDVALFQGLLLYPRVSCGDIRHHSDGVGPDDEKACTKTCARARASPSMAKRSSKEPGAAGAQRARHSTLTA